MALSDFFPVILVIILLAQSFLGVSLGDGHKNSHNVYVRILWITVCLPRRPDANLKVHAHLVFKVYLIDLWYLDKFISK